MNNEVKAAILEKIKEYNRIIITRHFRPDGDAIGSTKGLQQILKLSFPEKEIYLLNEDTAQYLAFLGPEDAPIDDALYAQALVIVLDSGNLERISNKKIGLAKQIIKIDHHIDRTPYGDLSWVEDQRSSVCEMIADFYDTFRAQLKIDTFAATCLYTGMVTDSGRFRYDSVSGETLRCAAILLDQGIDTETLFAQLYLKDFAYLKFQSYIQKKMRITENGVAYIFLTQRMQKKFKLSSEEASTVISFLDSIRGSIVYLAFIEGADGAIRVRLRSRFVATNQLAELHGGGGHAMASGATVHSKKELRELLAQADELIRDYKSTHEGWL